MQNLFEMGAHGDTDGLDDDAASGWWYDLMVAGPWTLAGAESLTSTCAEANAVSRLER